MIVFMNPKALWLLVLIPLIIFIYYKAKSKKKALALKFSKINLVKAAAVKKKYQLKVDLLFYIMAAIILIMILGFADPHIPLKQTKEGVNVVLALDVSGSMQADDYKPNRLESAKRSAEILIKSLEPKDKVGIIIFSSGATTSAYLTPDKDKALDKLEDIVLRGGRTAIGDGVAMAVDMASSIPNRKKVVILLSDGVSNGGYITPEEATAYANENNIQVFTIGMGSEEPVILSRDIFGNAQYAELDEETLKSIATNTEGQYYKSVDDETLADIYKKISKEIKREKELTSIKDWFFIAAFLLVILQAYLRYWKYRVIS